MMADITIRILMMTGVISLIHCTGRVVLIEIALNERIRHDRLRAADVRPASAEGVAGDLRHREQPQQVEVEAMQAA